MNVQSIRPPVDSDGSHGSCKSDDDTSSRLPLTGFNACNGSDESGKNSDNSSYGRVIIRKTPLSRTTNVLRTSGMKFIENQPQTGKYLIKSHSNGLKPFFYLNIYFEIDFCKFH